MILDQYRQGKPYFFRQNLDQLMLIQMIGVFVYTTSRDYLIKLYNDAKANKLDSLGEIYIFLVYKMF